MTDQQDITQDQSELDRLRLNYIESLQGENKRLHTQLLEIHTIAQCVAECPDVQEGDSLTVKAVKGMAHQIKMLEAEITSLRAQVEEPRKYPEEAVLAVFELGVSQQNICHSAARRNLYERHKDKIAAIFKEKQGVGR